MTTRVTQAMLERALGGAHVLVQLTDKDRDGVADSAVVSEILDEAEGELNSALRVQVELTDASLATDTLVLRYQRAIARFLAYEKGTGALSMPDDAQRDYDRAREWMTLFARRERGLGGTTQAASSQEVAQVTKDDNEDFFSQSSPRARFNGWA